MGFLDFIFGTNKNEDTNIENQEIQRVKQIGKYAVLNNESEENIEYDIPCKIKNVLISKNGKYIVSSAEGQRPSFNEFEDMEEYYDDGPHKFAALRVWEYGTFKILREFVNIDVKGIDFSNDSQIFAIAYQNKDECGGNYCSKENYIDIIDTSTFKTIKSIILDESECCIGIALNSDSKYIAARICKKINYSIEEHYIKIFDIKSCQEVSKINLDKVEYYYKSSIMKFSYDDKFLIFTLDENLSGISSPLSIVDMSQCKERYRIDSVYYGSIDIGNISNKLIFYGYENNHGSYYILQMDSDILNKIQNYESSGTHRAKFNLDDSKCFVTGYYIGDSDLNNRLTRDPIYDAISVFDSDSLKNIKTINLSKITGYKVDGINYIDVTRYNELLVFCDNYKGYNYLACMYSTDLSTIYIKNIPSSIKLIGDSSTSYCREKEVIVFNRYYCGSHDHTFIFSTYEEALNNLADIDREYFNDGKYEQLNSWIRNL